MTGAKPSVWRMAITATTAAGQMTSRASSINCGTVRTEVRTRTSSAISLQTGSSAARSATSGTCARSSSQQTGQTVDSTTKTNSGRSRGPNRSRTASPRTNRR